ncbi:unnamed protein product [Effrenium voratum]|nr:unnamed protein product [Effrenium voratum]
MRHAAGASDLKVNPDYSFALPVARGHGQLTRPLVRQDSDGETESWRQRAPVYTLGGNRDGYSATSMRCHDFQPTVGGKGVLDAGLSFEATWTMEAGHPGDCYFYLSYDDPSNAVNFFKIAAIPGCGAPDGINIPSSVTMSVLLPAELPACDHCVLRWEWTAHQQVSDIEFYVQCADVIIRSTAGNHLPSPVVAISGIEHLPQAADGYRKAYQGEGPEEQYLVGPAVATFSPCSADTPGCLVASGSSTTFGFSGTTTTVDPSDTATTVDPSDTATTVDPSDTATTVDPSDTATTVDPSDTATTVDPSDTATTVNTLDTATTVGTADAGNCPHAGELPSFVSECYCGFISSPAGDGCGADDGTACWCHCCCSFWGGGCRYQQPVVQQASATLRAGQAGVFGLLTGLTGLLW